MRHERPTEDCQEKAALYALGTLNQHEAASFEAHLREGCVVCKTLADHFGGVAAAAAFAVAEIEPPAYLRDLLAARVEREQPALPVAEQPPAPDLKPDAAAEPVLQRGPTPPAVRTLPPGRPAVLPWVLVVLLAAAAGICWWLWKQGAEQASLERERTEDARRMASEARAELETEKKRSSEFELVSAALANAGTQVIMLSGLEPAPSAAAAVFWDTVQGRWIVSASLPPAPAGKEYQLWFISGAAYTSATLLRQGAEGHAFTTVEIPPAAIAITGAAISLEEAGGAERPGIVYARGALCPPPAAKPAR